MLKAKNRLLLSGAVVLICAGCEREGPPPPLLPPPLLPPPTAPAKSAPPQPAVQLPTRGGRAEFAGVTYKLSSPVGNAKDGRGDIKNVYSKIGGGVLTVYIEFAGLFDTDLNYRFWVTNNKQDPPVYVLVEKGGQAMQIADGTAFQKRLPLGIDTTDGLMVKIQLADLPPSYQSAKTIWVAAFESLDLKTAGGKAQLTTHDLLNEAMEPMPLPGR
ncbi:MAG: hypothetical protein HY897_00810 [Deltaproteobacteria bacterium]|nr:hypothetical protein [Deltaproteobacteria bacterium]